MMVSSCDNWKLTDIEDVRVNIKCLLNLSFLLHLFSYGEENEKRVLS